MMNNSRFIADGKIDTHRTRLIKAIKAGIDSLDSYEIKPKGVFGSVAKIICGDVTINSNELDLEFNVKFDDDMEANECEIIIYNLTQNTIKQFKNKKKISIEAGYTGDTGVIFSGFITKVTTKIEEADKVTTIKCIDDLSKKTISEITYVAGTKASYILRDLLNKTGTPIAVFKMRRDWTYVDEEKVDGDLYNAIKTYSEVCGVSTYVNKGKIYSRYIKECDELSFTLSEDTGLIGSPEEFEEENTITLKVDDENDKEIKDTIKGYECECLLQHRFAAGGKVKLKSLEANGTYRICSGEHRFSPDECISRVKMY